MAGIWIPIKQYEGFSIYKEDTGIATRIKTPQGEFNLIAGQRFHFINPNTGSQNFAFPEVLLKRAESDGEPKAKKVVSPSPDEPEKEKREGGPLIIGYLIPEVTPKQLEDKGPLQILPVFSSEKGMYKKSLVFDTLDAARESMIKKYGRFR
jgi:hypothetical protein